LEEEKSEGPFSQSSISGNPSPFTGSVADLGILTVKNKRRPIRNKSCDDF